MTDYTTITNDQVDVDSPLTEALVKAIRDNPIAISEGAASAPRNLLRSWEGLTAGDEIRVTFPDASSINVNNDFGEWSIAQYGVIRLKITFDANVARSILIIRLRGNAQTTIDTFSHTGGGVESFISDIPVLPGDTFYFRIGSGSGTIDYTDFLLCTGGEDVFPAPSLYGYMTGNRAAL